MESRKSKRVNCSIGWVDNINCLSITNIINDLLITSNEWNLYCTNEGNCRHAFVINKNITMKTYYFYDYQGNTILKYANFCTTIVYNTLKEAKSYHGWNVSFGQKHCIEGDDYSHLCMKNSAFVMKYHCAPKDKR